MTWAVAAGSVPALLGAQSRTGQIHGAVRDSGGLGLTGAEIRVAGTALRARTNERGEFRLVGVAPGRAVLEARRLGFKMDSASLVVGADSVSNVDMRLASMDVVLSAVVVRSGRSRYTGRLAGFYERIETNTNGYFITRDRIEEGDPRVLTNVLQRVPGLEIVRGGRVRMRGRSCAPLVWIDGVQMPAGEVDLNSFPPNSIQGIELYPTASGAPIRYSGTVDRARCGTILLWSRGPDTELPRRPIRAVTEELERRVEAREVFTGTDVEEQAEPAGTGGLTVAYPPELYADGKRGSVVAEFVVDSTGRVEAGSFGVVRASHPLFARAVQEAVEGAVFRPARRGGQPVAQVVQMPFQFDPQGRGRRRRG